MVIVWGQQLYGKVERVKGEVYVATQFFHLWYFPLIPLKSFIVFEGTETPEGFQGKEIPIHMKSVFFSYLRGTLTTIAIFMGVFAGLAFLIESKDSLSIFLTLAGIFGLSIASLLLTFRFSNASRESIEEMKRQLSRPY